MEEKKVRLSVLGFSFNQTQSGTYGLVLAEDGGLRRLMIVVGAPEAQSIAFRLQNTEPPRPLSHDLFTVLMAGFDITLDEVYIYKYENGIFYSRLMFRNENQVVFIESRTSDAIGIALRTGSQIFTTESIMQELAVVFTSSDEETDSKEFVSGNDSMEYVDTYALLSKEDLESMLQEAVSHEDYELASVLKEEIDKRKKM